MTDAPTTRETADHAERSPSIAEVVEGEVRAHVSADHAELVRLVDARMGYKPAPDTATTRAEEAGLASSDDRRFRKLDGDFRAAFTPAVCFALLSEIAALRGEVERSLPSISFDGEHAISDHRRWLARQLLDSKLDDEEAYGIVAYHPAITDLRTTQAEGLLREILPPALCGESWDLPDHDVSHQPMSFGWIKKARTFLANQGADQ